MGSGGVSFDSALAGVGTWGFLASGALTLPVSGVIAMGELSDTRLAYKHFEEFGNLESFLDLT